MNVRHVIEERILALKTSAQSCGTMVLSGDVIGDIEHYFNQAGDELGYVYRPFFKSETVCSFDVPRKWSPENKAALINRPIIITYFT